MKIYLMPGSGLVLEQLVVQITLGGGVLKLVDELSSKFTEKGQHANRKPNW